jgi:hypothetical protein
MALGSCLTDAHCLTQVRIDQLAVQNKVSDLALAPIQFLGRY